MGQTKSQKVTPGDRALFQKLREASAEHSRGDGEEIVRLQQVHESMKQWEDAKETLTEIQGLLSQAYREIELMEIEN